MVRIKIVIVHLNNKLYVDVDPHWQTCQQRIGQQDGKVSKTCVHMSTSTPLVAIITKYIFGFIRFVNGSLGDPRATTPNDNNAVESRAAPDHTTSDRCGSARDMV